MTNGPRGIDAGAREYVERICGIRIGAKEMRRQLRSAVLRNDLIYRPYDKNKRGADALAGYFPAPVLAARGQGEQPAEAMPW